MKAIMRSKALFVLAAASATLLGMSGPSLARDHGRTNAAIDGFIAGTAVTAALSPGRTVVKHVYVPYGPPYYPTNQDSFTPTAGIICYSSQHACYTLGGGYNPNWTWKIFAR